MREDGRGGPDRLGTNGILAPIMVVCDEV